MRVPRVPASSMRMSVPVLMAMPVAFAMNVPVIVRIVVHHFHYTPSRVLGFVLTNPKIKKSYPRSSPISPFLIVIGHFDTLPVRII